MKRSQKNRLSPMASVGFILLGVYALWATRDMSELGSVFPRAIGSAMIVFSAVDMAWSWFRPRLEEKPPPGSAPRRVVLVSILLLWALLMRPLGFLVTSVVASLLLLLVAHHGRWTPARAAGYVLGTLAVVGSLYCVFALGLGVPLPAGILF